jgi:hypothetical protein
LASIVAACSEHVACRLVRRASNQFAYKIKLPGSNHILDGGDIIEYVSDFVIPNPVVLDLGHCDVKDAADPAMHEDFEFVQESLSHQRPCLTSP